MVEAPVTGIWLLIVVEAVGEIVPAMDMDSGSEDESIAKDRVSVITLPLDLVNNPKVSEIVEPWEFTVV